MRLLIDAVPCELDFHLAADAVGDQRCGAPEVKEQRVDWQGSSFRTSVANVKACAPVASWGEGHAYTCPGTCTCPCACTYTWPCTYVCMHVRAPAIMRGVRGVKRRHRGVLGFGLAFEFGFDYLCVRVQVWR